MYYLLTAILNINAVYKFLVGARGCGKTYACKVYAIRRFLKTGKEFVWVRRYKSELKLASKSFMNDIIHKFPNHKFTCDSRGLFIDGKRAGYFMALSMADKYKSVSYPNVYEIYFDEFIIKRTGKYLPDEANVFKDLYSTIDRNSDRVTAFFIGNAISFSNPYFIDLKINELNGRFTFDKTKMAVVENYTVEKEFKEKAQNTRFGKLIYNTQYEGFSLDNKFLEDSDDFIAPCPKKCHFFCSMKLNNQILGFWFENETGDLYVRDKYDKGSKFNFAIKAEDHAPNFILIRKIKTTFAYDIRRMFAQGRVFFENQNQKKTFEKLLTYL